MVKNLDIYVSINGACDGVPVAKLKPGDSVSFLENLVAGGRGLFKSESKNGAEFGEYERAGFGLGALTPLIISYGADNKARASYKNQQYAIEDETGLPITEHNRYIFEFND